MKKLSLLAFCSLLIPLGVPGARAQQAPLVVTTCGTQSLTPGSSAREYIDVTGNLCSSATGGGGGGGAITAAAGSYAAGAFSVGAGTDGWDVTKGIKSQAACASDTASCSLLERLSRIAVNLTTLNATANSPSILSSQYPSAAVPITASAIGTTAATTATLAASASIKTYLCGFSIRASATAASTANSTVTGTVTGTLNFTQWTAPSASGLGITEMIFSPCVPSSAINTGIAVISAAPGTGGVVSVAAWGYQL